MCLHDSIESQCVARRLQQIKEGRSFKGAVAEKKKSMLNRKFVNMNYNNLVMQLRKLCNHPYLVLEDVKTIPDSLYFRDLMCCSGKLVVLDRLLERLLVTEKKDEHKILIFSQMTTMLNILEGFLQTRGISCYRLDGSTDRHTREEIIGQFFDSSSRKKSTVMDSSVDAADDSVRVFLLSTRAGELLMSSLYTVVHLFYTLWTLFWR